MTPVGEDLACAPGELALAWSREETEWGGIYAPASIDVAPGGALFARGGEFGADIVRMRDGGEVARIVGTAMDRSWARSIEVDDETRIATIRAVVSGDVLGTIALSALDEGWFSNTIAALSPEGDVAMLLECASESGTEATRTIVRAVPIAGGAESRVVLDVPCGQPWARGGSLHPLPGGRAAIVTGLREPGPWIGDGRVAPVLGIARVDFASGTAVTAFPTDETIVEIEGPLPTVGLPNVVLVHAALSDDGAELAIVGRDGMLRRLDATTLEPVAEPLRVPLFVANRESFVPSIASPVAYSTGNALYAHVDADGGVVLRDTVRGELVARLQLPFTAGERGWVEPVMAIRFVPDGVLVSTSTGVARFACGGAIADIERPSGELVLSATGPTELRIGEPVLFDVSVENATLPVVRMVRMGEGTGVGASLGPAVRTYSGTVGTYEAEITADDGTRTARTTATVHVSE